MPRPKAKVEAGLKNKGFVQEERDHSYFIYWTEAGEKTPVKTKTSHSPKMKDIPDNILAMMARQCHLEKRKFIDLVECPLSRSEYEQELRDKDQI